MVGPFGGITAAAFLNAAASHSDRLGDPVALTVNFAAAIADGEFYIEARPARTNRSTQHWTFELTQQNEVAATATAVFAVRRATWGDTEATQVAAPAPETLEPVDYPAVTWAAQYDKRFVEGAFPVEGEHCAGSTSTLWVRDLAGRRLDYPGLAALSDVFYPRIFLRRGGLAPAGTVSLTTYFHADRDQLEEVGDDFVLCTARANRFVGGFFDQSAELWSRAGQLLVTSHQIVYFKA
jgi:acyl-CoA thioesterase